MKPLSAAITIIVLILTVQTVYAPQYCVNAAHGSVGPVSMDRRLAHGYCDATKVRDRNAPLSQLIDTTNYDLVLLGDALGDIGSKISELYTGVLASTK